MASSDTTLLDDLEAQRALLIAVATGGPRIQDKNAEYTQRRARIRAALAELGIADPIPFGDLWSWYGKWSSGDLPRYQMRRDFIANLFQPLVDRAITPTVSRSAAEAHIPTLRIPSVMAKLKIFISHSSKDSALVRLLIDLLRASLNLPAESIRCTSVDGYRLAVGSSTNDQLRIEVREAEALIGILTPHSVNSAYVLFELGARWGAGLFLAPVLAGVSAGTLGGPLSGINALHLTSRAEIHQLIGDLAEVLGARSESPAVFERQLHALLDFALAMGVQEKSQITPYVAREGGQVRPTPVSDGAKTLLSLVQSEADSSARGIVQIVEELEPGITHFFPKVQYGGEPVSMKSRVFREAITELVADGYFYQPEVNNSTGTITFEYRDSD